LAKRDAPLPGHIMITGIAPAQPAPKQPSARRD
jgi:hypothetical protein